MTKNMHVAVAYVITHMGLMFYSYPADVIESTKEAHWLPIMVGFLFHLTIISVYMKGISLMKGQNLITVLMNKNKGLAWAALFPVSVYLFVNIILTVRSYAEIISIIFLSNTPLWVLMLLLLIIPAYMALHGGAKGLMRTSLLLAILFILPILFVLINSFQHVDFRYALPLLPTSSHMFSFLLHPAYYKSIFVFTAGFLFLGFIPSSVPYKPKTIIKSSFMLLPLYLFSVYIPILTLGQETARQLEFPYTFTVDTIEIDWLMFDRITVFMLLSLMAFSMMFIAVTFWCLQTVIRQSIKDIRPLYLMPVIVVVSFSVCLSIPDWKIVDHAYQLNSYLRGYVALTIPPIALIAGRSYIRQMNRELK
ncbi:GerAB/ArcD/ProY family transporter [Paenibacillus sp. R14(2021)]|uniref:GerAB/ArcD/ProY family transporter n=1 Tax=Paenibacillus sp. R14(2021) TaxID=2859228 RepID=UPI001C613EBD|nr:GerAB/ArcD/ProY family transporter [Paenibacillus sp. R14(2021)]